MLYVVESVFSLSVSRFLCTLSLCKGKTMKFVEQYWEEHPEQYERLKAIKEQSRAINRKRRLKAYKRLQEVEKYKERLYGRKHK